MDIMKTLLRFNDKSNPETIKKPVYLVDTDIRRLVSCMNLNEYKTYASAKGIPFPWITCRHTLLSGQNSIKRQRWKVFFARMPSQRVQYYGGDGT